MTVDVTTEIFISRPVVEVAAFAANPDNVKLWYENITDVEWQTPPPLRVGSRIAFVANFLRRRLAYTYELMEWTANERFVMSTSEGPFPMETSYSWSPRDGGTLMTLRNRGEVRGFSRLVAPLMMPAMRRANRKDLAALKRLLEGRDIADQL